MRELQTRVRRVYEPIITNNAQARMKKFFISKAELMAAFSSKTIEKGLITGSTTGITKIGGYEICAMYKKDPKGQWIIISCWKRKQF